MSIQEQARKINVAKRSQERFREESMLSRVAKEVGMTIADANSHSWKLYVNG
jgi:hypothetical protein